MTQRDEEILKASIEFHEEEYKCDGISYHFIEGAKWADEHPKNGFVSVDTVYRYLVERCFFTEAEDYLDFVGFTKFGYSPTNAWGNNGATNRSGGNLGNGGETASPDPVYIMKSATLPMDNCASISDGDTWGFITTTSNEIYTWGDNSVGQLGIGSTTHQKYAVKMNRICNVPDPKPVISFPEDFFTCVPFSYELNSNFVNTNNNYKYEWFKDGVALTAQGTTKTKITILH